MATINGTNANDTLNGTINSDILNGLDGDDRLRGGQGDDVYNGGAGDDRFLLSQQETITSETYNGGTGSDTLVINHTATFRTLTLDTAASVEVIDFKKGYLHGSNQNDTIDISGVTAFKNFANFINLGNGDDVFIGSAIADKVTGGKGSDTLNGNDGNDRLRGGAGDDVYNGGAGNDLFLLEQQERTTNETYNGGTGSDTLVISHTATFRNLTLNTAASVEVIDFKKGYLRGSDKSDAIDISGVTAFKNFANQIDLGDGADTFIGSALVDKVTGGKGSDTLNGNDGNDRLRGGAGDDVYNGGKGDDLFLLEQQETINDETYNGGAGSDTLVISHTAFYRTLTLDAAASVEVIDFKAGYLRGTDKSDTIDISGVTKFKNFANQIDLGDGADTFIGSALVDKVIGGKGSDTLNGNDGNDRLRGGAGNDIYNGGNGDDRFLLNQMERTTTETYNGGAGSDTLVVSHTAYFRTLTLDVEASVEVIDFKKGYLRGTDQDDTIDISGVTMFKNFTNQIDLGDGADTFIGSALVDKVTGGKGSDTLNGNDGNDRLRGGAGDDVYNGGNGNDLFLLNQMERTTNETYNGGAGSDTLVISHTAYFQTLTLDAAASVEVIDFKKGYLRGTNQNDSFDLSGVTDLKNFVNIINMGDGIDTFIGSVKNDKVAGAGGNDALFGGLGNDRLLGGSGNDRLEGNKGNDKLTGGSGDDTFVFQLGDGLDAILDFKNDVDTLELDAALWSGTLSATQVVATYATFQDGIVTFDFGADEITVQGVSNALALIDDISIV